MCYDHYYLHTLLYRVIIINISSLGLLPSPLLNLRLLPITICSTNGRTTEILRANSPLRIAVANRRTWRFMHIHPDLELENGVQL